MKKSVSAVIVVALLILAAVLIYKNLQAPAGPTGEALLPPDTMVYSGSRNALKLGAGLKFADVADELEDFGLTPEESRRMDHWIKNLRSVHFGLSDITLLPLSLEAIVILEGHVDTPLMDVLPEDAAARFTVAEPYRKVGIRQMELPLGDMARLNLFITEPVKDRIFVSLSRILLTETIDRLLDGGPSLADSPNFQQMTGLPEISGQDVISYVDLQKYMNLIFGIVNTLPFPQAHQVVQIMKDELRLDEWGPAVTGQSLLNRNRSISFTKVPEDLPLYQQLQFSRTAEPTTAPADAAQVFVLQLNDAAKARQQLTDLIERIVVRAAPMTGMQLPPNPVTLLEQMIGFSLKELDPLLSGDIMVWQKEDPQAPGNPGMVLNIGITDEYAMRRFIELRLLNRIGVQPIEQDGISILPGANSFAWSVRADRLVISNDPDLISRQLQSGGPSLTETTGYQALRSQLPENASFLQYVNYSNLNSTGNLPPNFPRKLIPMLTMIQTMSIMQTAVAENGMIRSDSVFQTDLTEDDVRNFVRGILEWAQNPEAPSAP